MVWSGRFGNGQDPMYRAALAGTHEVYSRVDVLSYQNAVLASDVQVYSGTVTATLASRVVRTLDLEIPDSYFPVKTNGTPDTSALFSPFGNRLAAYRGIRYGDGQVVYFPVFLGCIQSVVLTRPGKMAVRAVDLADEVVSGLFETPTNSNTALTVLDQYKALVNGAVSSATFGSSDVYSAFTPALIWQSDRAGACDQLASSVGGLWYPLADGSFVLRQAPWSAPGKTPVLSWSDGTGGLVGDFTISLSRANTKNSVVFATERLNGEPPITAVARDELVTSATYFKGPFGLKPLLIQNQGATTQAQAAMGAQMGLAASKLVNFVLDNLQTLPDASLELGDLVTCSVGGVRSVQAVVGFTLDLRETSPMPVTLRPYQPIY